MKKINYLDLQKSNNSLIKIFNKKISSFFSKGTFILGDEVRKFEKKFSLFSCSKYAIGVGSGLDALILLLKTQDLKKNDEVIVQANSYIATAICVDHVGAKLKFVDCCEDNFGMDIQDLKKKINKKTKIIIPTSLYGIAPKVTELNEIAKKFNLKIIEDASQSHGINLFSQIDKKNNYQTPWIGSTFSFYPTKNLGGFGDGGCVITNSKIIKNNIYSLRNYGQSNQEKRYNKLGFNSRLDELQATLLIEKLKKIKKWNKIREKLANIYFDNLEFNTNIILVNRKLNINSRWHVFPIRVKNGKRDKLKKYLSDNKILTNIHYDLALHKQPYYLKRFKNISLPNSEKFSKQLLSLPLDHINTQKQIIYICDKINNFFKKY